MKYSIPPLPAARTVTALAAPALTALVLAAIALTGGCQRDEQTQQADRRTFEWKMITSWPTGAPGLGTAAENMAANIEKMSRGRLKVRVYGAGELVPGLEVFDTVSSGSVQMGHSAAYYWRGKIPAAQFFSAVPFGMTADEQNAWLYYGGGLQLWHKLYRPFGLIAFPAGNTGPQWGGWFRRELHSAADLKGLIMRIPGMGGEVISRAGAQQVQLAGAEVFAALETGTIDAAEWTNPFSDLSMGFYQIAPFYYYPGWQEAGVTLELMLNLEAWNQLPEDLQTIVKVAAQAANQDMFSQFGALNPDALKELRQKGVQVRPLPTDMLLKLRTISAEAVEELAASDADAAEVYTSWKAFYDKSIAYRALTEDRFVELRRQPDPESRPNR